jgi:hypothetical protein
MTTKRLSLGSVAIKVHLVRPTDPGSSPQGTFMKAFSAPQLLALPFLTALAVLAVALPGCAAEVEARPPRRPEVVTEVVYVEQVQAVAPSTYSAAYPQAVVTPATRAPVRSVTANADASEPSLDTWASRHSEAARALGTWVHNNPEAASEVFTFDAKRPGRSRELVLWAVRHPGEDISVFTSKHPEWEWFVRVMSAHRLGADQFLAWCRLYPTAAEELVQEPSGLRWVGDHLYASDWQPGH